MLPWLCLSWLGSCALSAIGLQIFIAQAATSDTTEAANPVYAHVGSSPVTLGNICFQLGIDPAKALEGPGLVVGLRERTVHLIGLQRQARQSLLRLGLTPTSAEVERYLKEHQLEPKTPYITQDELKNLVEFRLAWKAYILKHVNDKNLQKHFENQRARFDGTQFKIKLVSIAVPPGESPIRRDTLDELTAAFKDARGTASFDTAVAALVEAHVLETKVTETKVRGTGDVEPVVISELLKLQPGGVSQPFSSAVAVHVVQLIDVEPGTLPLNEVVGEVRAHMLIYLLEHLASLSAQQLPLTTTTGNKSS